MVDGRRAETWQHTARICYYIVASNSADSASIDPESFNPYRASDEPTRKVGVRGLFTMLTGMDVEDGS